MILTGKCKEDFEKWMHPSLISDYKYGQALTSNFELLPPSMQYGVYVDFFDSVSIRITLDFNGHSYLTIDTYNDDKITGKTHFFKENNDTRQEAREQAILKANEIYNE